LLYISTPHVLFPELQVTALTEDFAAMPKSKGRKRAKIGGGSSTSNSPKRQAFVQQHNKQFPEVRERKREKRGE
jgi:hypothetical protein